MWQINMGHSVGIQPGRDTGGFPYSLCVYLRRCSSNFLGGDAFDLKNIFILLFYVDSYFVCMYICASYSCLLSMEAGRISLTLWYFQDAIYIN